MKKIIVPLAWGAILLLIYSTLFVYATYSLLIQVLFVLAPFILSWIAYKMINNVNQDVKKEVLSNKNKNVIFAVKK